MVVVAAESAFIGVIGLVADEAVGLVIGLTMGAAAGGGEAGAGVEDWAMATPVMSRAEALASNNFFIDRLRCWYQDRIALLQEMATFPKSDKRNDLTISLNPGHNPFMMRASVMVFWLLLGFGLMSGVAARAAPAGQIESPGQACLTAAQRTTRRAGLPSGMLRAIGMVETGHVDPDTGALTPWPYAVDVDGVGRWFNRARSAVAYVHQAMAGGAHFIDVGCFQIDLADHPNAFSSLQSAFDPADNARYAAHFLNLLHGEFGSWPAAIAAYHAGTPALGVPYAQHVLSVWQNRASMRVLHAAQSRIIQRSDPYVIHLRPDPIGGLPKIVTP